MRDSNALDACPDNGFNTALHNSSVILTLTNTCTVTFLSRNISIKTIKVNLMLLDEPYQKSRGNDELMSFLGSLFSIINSCSQFVLLF